MRPPTIVARTETSIGLDLDGYPDEGPNGDVYITDYVYRDGFYDPIEKQFRGFSFVKQIQHGDERFGGSGSRHRSRRMCRPDTRSERCSLSRRRSTHKRAPASQLTKAPGDQSMPVCAGLSSPRQMRAIAPLECGRRSGYMLEEDMLTHELTESTAPASRRTPPAT